MVFAKLPVRLIVAFLLFVIAAEWSLALPQPEPQFLPAIVFDAHVDPGWRILDLGQSFASSDETGQVSIPKWRAGGVNIVWIAIWVDPRRYSGAAALQRADALIDALTADVRRNHKTLALCRTSDECIAAVNRGKIALLLGLEGGEPLLQSPQMVDYFWRKGIRRITLTWRGDLSWAGSSQNWDQSAVRRQKGLSEIGAEIIQRMNMYGVVVDLSHASELTARDALSVSQRPCIFSHSNSYALCPHPRNVSDDLLQALAKNGGVIGVNFHSKFLARSSLLRGFGKNPRATVDDVVRHIDHIRSVIGVDHIGIGSDWDGDIVPAKGLEDASRLPQLWQALRERGYTADDIRKIAAENFLRVLRANEQKPHRLAF